MNTSNITLRISEACASTKAGTKARRSALASIRWVLAHESGLCAGLNGSDCALVHPDKAQVFTGCDNEVTKLRFWQLSLGASLNIVAL